MGNKWRELLTLATLAGQVQRPPYDAEDWRLKPGKHGRGLTSGSMESFPHCCRKLTTIKKNYPECPV